MSTDAQGPKLVYEFLAALPEIGAAPGDVLIIESTHPTPILIVREHDEGVLDLIALSGRPLGLISSVGDAPTPARLSVWFRDNAGSPASGSVSEPIEAGSDDTALVELLWQVGGR